MDFKKNIKPIGLIAAVIIASIVISSVKIPNGNVQLDLLIFVTFSILSVFAFKDFDDKRLSGITIISIMILLSFTYLRFSGLAFIFNALPPSDGFFGQDCIFRDLKGVSYPCESTTASVVCSIQELCTTCQLISLVVIGAAAGPAILFLSRKAVSRRKD